MTNYWLGVVSADHVARAVQLGIAQANHGTLGALRRMLPGDGLIYYSPQTSLRDGRVLQAFTAVGRVADGEPWQADEGQFQPWRRSVNYDDGTQVALQLLKPCLLLTQEKNWGYALRRGVIPLAGEDFTLIRTAMLEAANDKDMREP